jgi:Transposase, Mutator family
MYLAGVSVRRVEDITEALWGTRVSPSTVSDLNKRIYATIEAWRNQPIEGWQSCCGHRKTVCQFNLVRDYRPSDSASVEPCSGEESALPQWKFRRCCHYRALRADSDEQ